MDFMDIQQQIDQQQRVDVMEQANQQMQVEQQQNVDMQMMNMNPQMADPQQMQEQKHELPEEVVVRQIRQKINDRQMITDQELILINSKMMADNVRYEQQEDGSYTLIPLEKQYRDESKPITQPPENAAKEGKWARKARHKKEQKEIASQRAFDRKLENATADMIAQGGNVDNDWEACRPTAPVSDVPEGMERLIFMKIKNTETQKVLYNKVRLLRAKALQLDNDRTKISFQQMAVMGALESAGQVTPEENQRMFDKVNETAKKRDSQNLRQLIQTLGKEIDDAVAAENNGVYNKERIDEKIFRGKIGPEEYQKDNTAFAEKFRQEGMNDFMMKQAAYQNIIDGMEQS